MRKTDLEYLSGVGPAECAVPGERLERGQKAKKCRILEKGSWKGNCQVIICQLCGCDLARSSLPYGQGGGALRAIRRARSCMASGKQWPKPDPKLSIFGQNPCQIPPQMAKMEAQTSLKLFKNDLKNRAKKKHQKSRFLARTLTPPLRLKSTFFTKKTMSQNDSFSEAPFYRFFQFWIHFWTFLEVQNW